jgi:hypothetical protein
MRVACWLQLRRQVFRQIEFVGATLRASSVDASLEKF